MPTSPLVNRNMALLLGGLGFATFSASIFNALLGIPLERLLIIAGLMLLTGGISLVVGYSLYQQRAIRFMRSMHMSLTVNTVLTIVIVFVNVLIIALSMFIT